MRPQADAGEVAVSVDVAGFAAYARGNPEQIQRVLFNLLQNAIRHTPADGSVTVRAAPREAEVEIEVADTGEGIDPGRSGSACSRPSYRSRARGAHQRQRRPRAGHRPRDRRGARRAHLAGGRRRGHARAVQPPAGLKLSGTGARCGRWRAGEAERPAALGVEVGELADTPASRRRRGRSSRSPARRARGRALAGGTPAPAAGSRPARSVVPISQYAARRTAAGPMRCGGGRRRPRPPTWRSASSARARRRRRRCGVERRCGRRPAPSASPAAASWSRSQAVWAGVSGPGARRGDGVEHDRPDARPDVDGVVHLRSRPRQRGTARARAARRGPWPRRASAGAARVGGTCSACAGQAAGQQRRRPRARCAASRCGGP